MQAADPTTPCLAGRRRARRLRLLALAAVLPSTLLICELAVRLLDLGPAPRPQIHGSVVRPVSDPVLRFVTVPSSERVVVYPPFGRAPRRQVVQRLNEQGFRGSALRLPKPCDVLRIVCVGDSHTFGEGVDDSETWPGLLEARLRGQLSQRVEVANAGVQGYDTAQEALWLEHFALDLEPDLVLLQFFINDANGPGRSRPGADDGLGWLVRAAHPRQQGLTRWLRQRSRLVDAGLEAVFRREYFDHWSAGNARYLIEDAAAWAEWCAAIARIDELMAERAVPYAVVLYPMMHAPGGQFASAPVHRRVAAHLEAEGISYLDAEPAFHASDPTRLRVHPGDLHAGAQANRIFADAVAAWLETWEPYTERLVTSPRPASRMRR